MALCDDYVITCPIQGVFEWSKDSGDGHLNELICDTQNPEICKVPYAIASNVTDTGLTLFDVIGEAVKSENLLNTMSTDIGIDASPLTSTHDNVINAGDLGPTVTALYSGVRHCIETNSTGCAEMDSHLETVSVRINTNSNFEWDTFEECVGETPLTWDLEKTLNHEFNHMMGFGHNPDGESIVSSGSYTCGQDGYVLTFHDIEEVLLKYGGDWVVSDDFIITETLPGENIMNITENIIITNNSTLTINPEITLDVNFTNQNITIESGSGLLIKNGSKIT